MGKEQIRVSAAIFIVDTEILVEQRRWDTILPLKWQFPGGTVEPEETYRDALVREVQEELGVEVVSAELVGESVERYESHSDTHISFYRVDSFRGEIHAAEGQVLKWVDVRRPHSLDMIAGNEAIFARIAGELGDSTKAWNDVWSGSAPQFSDPEVRRNRVERKFRLIERMGFTVESGDRILDLGCGTGEALRRIDEISCSSEKSVVTLGLDKSWPALTNLTSDSDDRRLIAVVNADAGLLPLASASMNTVLAFGLLEHTMNPERVVTEIARVLVSGGSLYLSHSNTFSAMNVDRMVSRILGRWPYGHQLNLTPRQLDHLLGRHLSLERTVIDLPMQDATVARIVDGGIHRLWSDWGRNIIVKAVKT